MSNKEVSKELEGVITQMLKPLKKLPLSIVIEGLSGYKVLEFDKGNEHDQKNLKILKKVAEKVLKEIKSLKKYVNN